MSKFLDLESEMEEKSSGCASLIGQRTGKVLSKKVRSKTCRTCEVAERTNRAPRDHKCLKNHVGSSKGTEPALVVDMISDVMAQGHEIKEIAGDDDTTGFIRAQNELQITMQKRSDRNHIKKNIMKKLLALKQKHKSLSDRIINYIMKNFSYMLAQNVENVEGIRNGLLSVVEHMYGNHSHFDTKWCIFIKNPAAKFYKLPYGKPLTDTDLKKALTEIFITKMSLFAEKLAYLSSTQANESLNNMLATKAPKYKHYSSSSSLHNRYNATVLQKNEGHAYISQFHQSIGLSPGNVSMKRASFMDKIKAKYSKLQKSNTFKKRRLQLKTDRNSKNTVAEVLEGTTYQENIENEEDSTSTNLVEIPVWEEIISVQSPVVVFDLETTGLSRQSDVLQISAASEEKTFNVYVMPSKRISPQATEVTKLKMFDGQMLYNDVPVDSVLPFEAFSKFIFFLSEFSAKPVLLGHNIKSFDVHILFNQLNKLKMWGEFCNNITHFVDTKLLFRNYTQAEKVTSNVI